MRKMYMFLFLILSVIITVVSLFFNSVEENTKQELNSNFNEVRGIFISYIDLEKHFDNKNESELKYEIDKIVGNLKQNKFNLAIVQVRSHANSIYKSDLFPKYNFLSNIDIKNFDPLEYFISKCHELNITFYAWINPYRISSNKDINIIKDYNYYSYIADSITVLDQGLYLNPSHESTNNLILSGAKEVLNYNIDGILFDDYFYPTTDIDIKEYEEYKKNGGSKSLNDYHLDIVNSLIKSMYDLCHSFNKKFGVSPSGNIETNYLELGADVKLWGSTNGYVDFLMPQVYYGFNNEYRPFVNTSSEWNNLIKNDNISLIYALALYKQNLPDKYAGSGTNEWLDSNNIIKKQIITIRSFNNYSGFSLFRYDSFYDNKTSEVLSLIELF